MGRQLFLGTDFRRRVTTAAIGGPLILGVLVIGSPVWDISVITIGIICVLELHRMIAQQNRLTQVGMIAIFLVCLPSLYRHEYGPLVALILIYAVLQYNFMMASHQASRRYLLRNVLYAVVGGLYVGLPISMMYALRNMPEGGAFWTLTLFLTNWATDSMALIGGRLAGRNRLAPAISPAKTTEGAAIGYLSGVASGIPLALLAGSQFPFALLVSLLLPAFTIAGDLLESWIKRSFSVKDSGDLLPGHGGLLDRADGFLLSGPVLYFLLLFFG